MRISPLNLISTPVPVCNSLGLTLRVGLSSEDPMVTRHPSEPYDTFLSTYSPEGLLVDRRHLGDIPPNRRRFFDISNITRQMIPDFDHLCVVHRVPSRMVLHGSNLEDEIELPSLPDYSMFRSLVEYSFPQRGNGTVIFETPPKLNSRTTEQQSSNTLTFTCQTLLSESVNTYVVLIHYSVNPLYSHVASYHYVLHSLSGEQVASGSVSVGPFAITVLDVAQWVSPRIVEEERDQADGISAFTFVGYSDDASLMVVVLNASLSMGAVAVEHTHPSQAYIFSSDPTVPRAIKADAQRDWQSVLSGGPSR